METTPHLPHYLGRAALRERLRPTLTPRAWDNWLARAVRKWGFPVAVRLGDRSVAWSEDEVLAWLASRPRGGRFDGRRPTTRDAA